MARRLRAYALTQGRTHTLVDLPLEALAVAVEGVAGDALGPEHRRIMDACRNGPQSVVDLSSTLELPLGVVRVLLADLMSTGYVQGPSSDQPAAPAHRDLTLLEEVLDGIESL